MENWVKVEYGYGEGRNIPVQSNCPLCDSNAVRNAFTKETYTYLRCNLCGTLFVANPPAAAEIHARYSEDYYEAASLGSQDRKGYPSYMQAQESLTKSFTRKLSIVRERVPSGKLLDAGAAYGTFLRLANSYYEGVGIEVSHYAASVAKNTFGVDVRVASIEHSPPFQDDCFDVIVMWDIIEHLIKPVEALKEVQRMLKPGGYVFISTDDADHWLPKLLSSRWWALGAPLHLCHFSRLGMKLAFERAGKYEFIDLISDKRQYSIPEIIEHFGVSYQSNFLTKIGTTLGQTPLGSWLINFKRPEQFIAIARKK